MTAAGIKHFARLFGSPPRHQARTLDRGSLPSPASYLRSRGLLVGKVRGDWASIRCPLHKGGAEKNPSLRVSLVDGHFRCHACGASGGDIVALHRLITGAGFREAVYELGGRFYD